MPPLPLTCSLSSFCMSLVSAPGSQHHPILLCCTACPLMPLMKGVFESHGGNPPESSLRLRWYYMHYFISFPLNFASLFISRSMLKEA